MCAESCMTGMYNKNTNPLRIRNPIDTMDEIEWLCKEYNPQRIKFLDPTWSVSADVVFAFCNEKLKRNNTIKWNAEVHASSITEPALEIMARANCDQIMVGCESGSQRSLDILNKRTTTNQIRKVFEWGKKYGIKRRAFFMIGIPGETIIDVRTTFNFVKELDPDIFGMTFMTPYPGSKYYDSKKFGDIDWSKCDEYGNNFWETEHFSNKELKDIQAWFNTTYKDILVEHQR